MNEGWGYWVLLCIGVYDNGEYLDEMENKFGVSLDWSIGKNKGCIFASLN